MRRAKVLIVDDEEPIVMGLVRFLYQDNERYDLLVASTGEIAQDILRSDHVDVMITDVRMPGISGLDLLCWASTESPGTRAIVITAFGGDGVAHDAYRFGCLQVIQKPFDLHRLRQRVLSALERRDGLSGTLSSLSPADVVQMLCLSQKTTALRVVKEGEGGLVYIEQGQIIHATWNDLTAEPAFFEMLRASGGVFNTLPLPENTPHTIDANWQFLLLEGMRVEDEVASGRSPARSEPRGGGETVVEPAADAAESKSAVEIAALVDEGFAALRAGDRGLARQRWEDALRLAPDNRSIELNLRKLRMLEEKT